MSGKPAARVGDKVAGNVIVSGSATVLIGDAGQGCADGACKGSPSVGSPVNPMLGIKVLSGETDFALAAPSPFVFTRSYASDDARIGPLGQGWSIPGASLYLEVSETATVMVDPQGRRITFDALVPGESLFSPSESLWIRRGGPVPGEDVPPPKAWDGRWIGVPEAVQRDPNAIVAMSVSGNDAFVFLAGPTRWRLAQVVDRNSYATEYQWSATGDLRAICDSAGRVYALVYTAHATTQEGDNGLRLAGVVLAFDPGRDDKPRSTFDPLAKDNDWLVRYGYDAEGDLVEVIDRMGQSVRYFGYRQHIMVRHGQPNGIDVRYTYDTYSPQGKVLTQRNLEGLDYSFEYQTKRTVVKDSLGRVEIYQFDGAAGLKRLARHVRADGSMIEHQYDYAGRRIASTDPLGRVNRVRLDGEGRELGTTRADGTTESSRYDLVSGDLLEAEDALGRRILFKHDGRGNPVTVTGPDGAVTRYIYSIPQLPDRPAQIIDAQGGTKQLTWTRLGLLASYTDCSGYVTRYTHDADGQLTSVMDALGHVTRHEYDRNGQLLTTTLPDGAVIRYAFDPVSRVASYTDPLGRVSRVILDRSGRVVRRVDPQGYSQNFAYDVAGRLKTLTNENGANFQFHYDSADRLVDELGFDGRRRQYRYNSAGELIEIEDVGGLFTRFERDKLGRVVAQHVPATVAAPAYTQSFQYDAAGQLVEARAPSATVLMTYDLNGRLIGETQYHADGWSYRYQHRHDTLGRIESTQYDGLPEVKWLTYGSGYLHGVRIDDIGMDIECDALHMEVRRKLVYKETATGVSFLRRYDTVGRLILHQMNIDAVGAHIEEWANYYKYDAIGLVSEIRGLSSHIEYEYDSNGRLIFSEHDERVNRYAFDPAGNRIDASKYCEYDEALKIIANNRVCDLNGFRYCYDAAGNVIELIGSDGGRLEINYDGKQQVASVVTHGRPKGDVRVSYCYDAYGRRISKTVHYFDGEVDIFRYGWDADRLIAQCCLDNYINVIYGVNNFVPLMRVCSSVEKVLPDADDFLVKISLDSAIELINKKLNSINFYCVDNIGTPMLLVDSVGGIVWRGINSDFSGVLNSDSFWQPIRFQGQFEDEETGLIYNRFRYMDKNSSRYLTQDPVGLSGGVNLYAYVDGKVTSQLDPLGLDSVYCVTCSSAGDVSKGRVGFLQSLMPTHTAAFSVNPIGGSMQSQIDYGNQLNSARANAVAGGVAAAGATGVVGLGARAIPVVGAAVGKVAKDVNVDGPSSGLAHGNGRVCGVRYKKKPIFRMDYQPYPGTGGQSRLHIHVGPDMSKHISVDPRNLF